MQTDDLILKWFNQDGRKAKISHVDRGIILLTSPPRESRKDDEAGETTDENGHDVGNNGSNPIIMMVHSDDQTMWIATLSLKRRELS